MPSFNLVLFSNEISVFLFCTFSCYGEYWDTDAKGWDGIKHLGKPLQYLVSAPPPFPYQELQMNILYKLLSMTVSYL